MEDGGYYALKGFDFQIDKTIIEIFSAPLDTDEISIERIQDLNSDVFVTQVKYKETQTYSPAKIRDPVVQLINEFSSSPTIRTYILYCFFSDQPENIKIFDLKDLDEVLEIKLHKNHSESHKKKYDAIKAIPTSVKNSFTANFQLIFAPNHSTQFDRALQLISEQNFCASSSDSSFYYCYLADHLRRLVISNVNPDLRVCTRRDLNASLTNKRNQIFYSTLDHINGREQLLTTLKKHFPKPASQQNNIIFIGSKLASETSPLVHLLTSITEQEFSKPTHDVYPMTFVIDHDNIGNIKKGLLLSNITFNDGYESIQFNAQQFNRKHISLRKSNRHGKALDSLDQISYKIRIITLNNFKSCHTSYETPDRTYNFDIDVFSEYTDIPSFQINDLSCDEIWQLIKRRT